MKAFHHFIGCNASFTVNIRIVSRKARAVLDMDAADGSSNLAQPVFQVFYCSILSKVLNFDRDCFGSETMWQAGP